MYEKRLIFGQKSLEVANVFYRVLAILSGAVKKNMVLVLDIIFI